VIADAYLAGVSTRRVEKLVQQLGVERMSRSQVSRLAKSLDQIVEDVRTRPLDGAPYAYLTLDALVVKCRKGGRTVNVCVVHAVAVNKTASASRSGSTSSPPRTAPPGSPSCARWSRAVAPASAWSARTRTPGLVDATCPRPGFSTEAVHTPARVNVTCVTPLGDEVASTS
jgi:hypothetical protein